MSAKHSEMINNVDNVAIVDLINWGGMLEEEERKLKFYVINFTGSSP